MNSELPLIPVSKPDIGPGEEAAVLRVLRSGFLAQGSEVAALENEFAAAIGVEHAVAVANGTAALHVALHAAGVRAGDDVLVPAFTFAASANAVLAVGANPVFVDIDEHFLIDLEDAARRITPTTTAIMPVHLFGLMADMDAMLEFATAHDLFVIEDAAQAHLARRNGRWAGATGVGAFSLYATKNMTTGEGGLVTTNDDGVAERARLFRNHGMPERYRHTEWGLNLRLTDLQAAIGRVQLAKLPEATERRRKNAALLGDGLPAAFRLPDVPADAYHVFHQFTVRVDPAHRDAWVSALRDRGIIAGIYYPLTLDEQPAFAGAGKPPPCPVARSIAREVMSLPVHPLLSNEDLDRVVAASWQVVESAAGPADAS